MSRLTKNEWLPLEHIQSSDFPGEDDFIVRTKEGHVGIGYKHPDGICYTIIQHGTVKKSMTFFPTDKNYQKPKEVLFFDKYKKNSPFWYKAGRHVSWRHDMPECKLILGYNASWIDKKNYASGIRLGYLSDKVFHSLVYNNNKDQYIDSYVKTEKNNMPEYWRFFVKD